MRRKRRQKNGEKKNWKKTLLKTLALVIGGFLFLLLLAGMLVNVVIDEDFLSDEIEKSINSDVKIRDLDISIFSFPAKITLSDVSLSPRGSETPAGEEPIRIEEVDLSVSLWGLLIRHIDVSHIAICGADVTSTHREDGETTLGEMFASPKEKRRKKKGKRKGKGKGSGFNVFDQEDFVATLGGFSIEDSRVDITLKSGGIRLICTDVNIELSAIEIDPNKLSETNTASLKLGINVKIDSGQGGSYGDLYLTGESTARVFNPETGDAEPDITGDISLGDGSWLSTRVPFVTSAWNYLAVLKPLGIKVAAMPEKALFGRSEAIAAHYHLGRITVLKPLSIWVGDWELAAMENSWLQSKTDEHEIYGELLASKGSSVHFRNLIKTGVRLFPRSVRDLVVADVEKQMFRDDRMWVKIKSSGDISNPKIRADGAVVDYTKLAKKAAKKLLKERGGGFLRGLFDKEDAD